MSGPDEARTPLEAAVTGAAGSRVVDALELLSDETRLAILLALWDGHDPYADTGTMSFSEIYDRVAVRDSANFSYHLDRLTDHFVEKTTDGYRLRNAGFVFVRTVIAGAGLENPEIRGTELDVSCTRCGDARMEIGYRNGILYLTCPECEGYTTAEGLPRGTIAAFEFDPAGLCDRSPMELLAAGAIRSRNRLRTMSEGVCPACSGSVDVSLRLCEEHDTENGAVCAQCGTRDSARVRYVCTVCKYKTTRPIELTVVEHPAVVSFYHAHDVDVRRDIGDLEGFVRGAERLWQMEHTVVSVDPDRVRVTVPCEGEELHLLLDENRDVIDRSTER